MLTTNRGITECGEIFDNFTVAAAMLDRLLHRAAVVAIDGESYRLRHIGPAPKGDHADDHALG